MGDGGRWPEHICNPIPVEIVKNTDSDGYGLYSTIICACVCGIITEIKEKI